MWNEKVWTELKAQYRWHYYQYVKPETAICLVRLLTPFFFFLRFQMVKVSIYCVQIYHRHTVTFCHTLQLTHNCASHDFCSDCFSPSMSVFRKILWSLVVVEWVAYSACILVCNISCDIWAKQRMSKHCLITSPLMKVTSGFSCYLLEVTK